MSVHISHTLPFSVFLLHPAQCVFLLHSAAGRLARAFAEGYYCESEQELMLKCGVRLPH